jgi:hypothetical protein
MKNKLILLLIFLTNFSVQHFCDSNKNLQLTENYQNLKFTGARASRYGIKPFPDTTEWEQYLNRINNNFQHSQTCVIWIVGIVQEKVNCELGFGGDESKFKHIRFKEEDQNEEFLNYFDQSNVKVFLQVEPANAHIPTLIHLVLKRYKHHKSVIGFGVDAEWYRESERPGWGMKVNDKHAKYWEKIVKSFNPKYKLFLKHWDKKWMPKSFRGDIIFISDSQMLENFEKMSREFTSYWADHFYPNMVFYQIGYPADSKWWEKLDNPVKKIGEHLAGKIKQDCGIFWVDFTLQRLLSKSYIGEKL